jgi:hypothetical protein
MAPGKNEGKTAFVRAVLTNNEQANPKLVNEAWKEAGHQGTISTTLVQKLRSEMGLIGNLGFGRKSKANSNVRKRSGRAAKGEVAGRSIGSRGARSVSVSSGGSRTGIGELEEMEGAIDRLIFSLMSIGGMDEVEAELRHARRLLVLSHRG